jgi:uncharacterized membrane protein YphA (DoxX/SURF4 family)
MQSLNEHLVARFPAKPLAAFRIILGLTTLLVVPELSGYLAKPEALEWDRLPWIPPASANIWVIIGCLYVLGAVAILIGLYTRIALVTVALLMLYTMYFADHYQNHLAFAVCMLLVTAISDSGAVWSLDALRRGADPMPDTVAAWPVTLIKLQTCALYLFAGINKLNPIFWTGDTIRVVAEDSFLWPLQPGDPFSMVYVPLGISAIVWELTAPFMLWIRGWPQKSAMVLGVIFHAGMAATLASSWLRVHGVLIFAFLAWGSYLLFQPYGPVLADRLTAWVTGREPVAHKRA